MMQRREVLKKQRKREEGFGARENNPAAHGLVKGRRVQGPAGLIKTRAVAVRRL
jgi:hypothetical protein